MRDVLCENCGEPIGQGYEINPANSKWCALCISDFDEDPEVLLENEE